MLKTIPRFPPKFKHRKINAIRDFPIGCQISSLEANSIPVTETFPPPAESEPFKVGNLASASNSNQKEEADEPHGSTENSIPIVETLPPPVEVGNLASASNSNQKEEAEEPHESTPPEKEIRNEEVVEDNGNEGWGEAIGNLKALESSELVDEGLIAKFEKPEAPDLFSENSGFSQFASRIFGVAKRRKMSAVRYFPAGCGRNASKIGSEDFMMAVSSESKTGWKEEEEVRKSKGGVDAGFENNDEDDEGREIAEPVKEKKVLESSGEHRVKSPKPRILEGKVEKKPLSKQQVVRKVGEVRNKVRVEPLLKRSWDENIMEEHKEEKFSMKPTSEKRMERSGVTQVSKNQIVKQLRDVSAPSGSKSVNKGGRSMMKKTIDNVSIKRSKDGTEEVQHEGNSARQMVKKTLRLFEKLVAEEETRSKDIRRVDLKAASILKKNNKCVNNGEAILGDVPGVEVGDEFHYRVELAIVGIHRPYQAGIDFMKRGDGKVVATSIVASGGYPDDLDSSDVLIYSGSGGNPDTKKNKQAGDQKLERGNLALKNSMDAKTPVRVIYGSKEQLKSSYQDSRAKTVTTFTYDGLYLVEKYWTETGTRGFSVFKFQLRRMPRDRITREHP